MMKEASTTSVSRHVAAARRSKTWLLALSIGIVAPAALLAAALALMRPAVALASFARQTGFECAACHVAFPELTPTGRLFKLKGYKMQGGDSPLPPIAGFLLPAFTHTQAGQPGGLPPNFGANSNFALQQASLFYGDAISSDLALAPSPRRPMTAPPIASAGTTSISASPGPIGISSTASPSTTIQPVAGDFGTEKIAPVKIAAEAADLVLDLGLDNRRRAPTPAAMLVLCTPSVGSVRVDSVRRHLRCCTLLAPRPSAELGATFA
jgi:hypothetical protein